MIKDKYLTEFSVIVRANTKLDEPQYVHCLACDDIFKESAPVIEVCPHCGNTDMQDTVCLQPDETDIQGFINMVKGI